jgi:hypothetical protein
MEPLQQEAPEEPDESFWFRPPWEAEPADAMPGLVPALRPDGPAGQGAAADTAALLLPLAEASAALARLDARLACAAPDAAEGLRARLALREAAGWLAHQRGTWIHPTDLGLREAGLTGSVTAAIMSGRLRRALPVTTADNVAGTTPDAVAEDHAVAEALQFARWWRRLAEHRSWSPLTDPPALRHLLTQLGGQEPPEAVLADWHAAFAGRPSATEPALLRAARASRAWAAWEYSGPIRADRLPTVALFLAACLWRRHGSTPTLALPLWSAPPNRLEALAFAAGPAWLAGFLTAAAEAAQRTGQELTRLQTAAARAAALRCTARSHLPEATAHALREPVLTAAGLATRLRISPQAALGLLRQLVKAGVLQETTGRAAWRAFGVA